MFFSHGVNAVCCRRSSGGSTLTAPWPQRVSYNQLYDETSKTNMPCHEMMPIFHQCHNQAIIDIIFPELSSLAMHKDGLQPALVARTWVIPLTWGIGNGLSFTNHLMMLSAGVLTRRRMSALGVRRPSMAVSQRDTRAQVHVSLGDTGAGNHSIIDYKSQAPPPVTPKRRVTMYPYHSVIYMQHIPSLVHFIYTTV